MGLVNSSLRSLVVASDAVTRLLILLAWPVNSFYAGSLLDAARNWDPDGVCWICCEGGTDLLHTGCACRGSAGLAHARCLEQAAVHDVNRWTTCPTCKQQWTGEMEVALARARYERVRPRPADDEERLFVQQNLAVALFESAGDPDGATAMLEEVLAVCRRVLGSENPLTLDALTNLALVYSEVGNYDAALPLSEEVVATTRRTRGADCEEAAHAIGSLAAVLNNVGEYGRARPLWEEALQLRLRLLGPSHLDTLNSKHGVGQCLVGLGEIDAGLSLLEATSTAARRVFGPGHESVRHFDEGLETARNLSELSDRDRDLVIARARLDS